MKKMVLVYVAGPYNSKTIFGKIYNILRARYWAKKIWRLGFAVICPHSNTAFFDYWRPIPESQIMTACVDMINRVDVVYVIPQSDKSRGVRAEINAAREINRRVILDFEKLKYYKIGRDQ